MKSINISRVWPVSLTLINEMYDMVRPRKLISIKGRIRIKYSFRVRISLRLGSGLESELRLKQLVRDGYRLKNNPL